MQNYHNPFSYPDVVSSPSTSINPASNFSQSLPLSSFTFGTTSPLPGNPYQFNSSMPTNASQIAAVAFNNDIPALIQPSAHTSTYSPQRNYLSERSNSGSFSHGSKRKSTSPPRTTFKQHITEERMALQLSQLSLSTVSERSKTSTITPGIGDGDNSKEQQEKRLYMCPEMQRLQDSQKAIFTQLFRDGFQKPGCGSDDAPCTALVPYVPPPFHLPLVPQSDDTNNNNNNERDLSEEENVMEMDAA